MGRVVEATDNQILCQSKGNSSQTFQSQEPLIIIEDPKILWLMLHLSKYTAFGIKTEKHLKHKNTKHTIHFESDQ